MSRHKRPQVTKETLIRDADCRTFHEAFLDDFGDAEIPDILSGGRFTGEQLTVLVEQYQPEISRYRDDDGTLRDIELKFTFDRDEYEQLLNAAADSRGVGCDE